MDAVTETPVSQPAQPVAEVAVVEAPKELTVKEHAAISREQSLPIEPKRRRPEDQARPEEVEEIGTLTARLREAEKVTGITRKPNESNRLYNLRMQTELAERLRDAGKQKAVEQPRAARTAPEPVVDFKEPAPTLEQFKDEADPADAYFRALARHEYRKEQHEAKKTEATTHEKALEAHQRQWWTDRASEHTTRLNDYLKANPTSIAADGKTQISTQEKFNAIGDKPLSHVMFGAIQIHPESAKMMMRLADDPDLHDELFLLTDGKPIGDPTRNPLIAIVQRRLLTKAQTVQQPERSPASSWKPPAPPPTPVRTQPTAIATSPDKESGPTSIMSHARKFHTRD